MTYVEGSWLAKESEFFPQGKKEAVGTMDASVGAFAFVADIFWAKTKKSRELMTQIVRAKAQKIYGRKMRMAF
ncbi:MAG: hypothetical protein H0W89_07910 [Candidatus Levybacteria bacterium]|nr:hypothetical protein [Candidatus Levybacteria bacterium]